eukprot:CAMPEP_0170149782 /NCGR_PEP_ID=MMETSP0033_2-20121228/44099_1 /TAXON_ID=195969 /ORGANISM="Dolichomastix tenuilepis, Strain CCMP3274" /LENGTH=93 /DNA_ID=CAMNT_0010386763 /DNA_START=1 /DNA_END=279 /DNA_ORIENTATION=+
MGSSVVSGVPDFTITAAPTIASKCFAIGDAVHSAVAGTNSTFTVQAVSSSGALQIPSVLDAFEVSMAPAGIGFAKVFTPTAVSNADGTYTVVY